MNGVKYPGVYISQQLCCCFISKFHFWSYMYTRLAWSCNRLGVGVEFNAPLDTI